MPFHLQSLEAEKRKGEKQMPQKRNKDKRVPYQFEVPAEIHKAGKLKSELNGVDIAPFMRMAFEQFVTTPIDKLLQGLRKHNEGKKRITVLRKKRPRPVMRQTTQENNKI